MPKRPVTPSAKSARTAPNATSKAAAATPAFGLPVAASTLKVAQELRRWTDNVLGIAGSATELSLNVAKARATAPREQASLEKAGSMLRQAREAAGMTTKELSQAIEIVDPKVLAQAEIGKAALPMEVILRLASVLGRHDPVPFAMKLARTYNPQLWKALDALGIGSLVALAGRERELANLYRANDNARRLSDADFADVLSFVKTGFDMTVKFRTDAAGVPVARRVKAAAQRTH
jgi:transcriptional regulator with XRE-family HTH domain